MCLSIHKTDKSMDRVGKATDYNFSVISHAELVDLITFSLCSDNFCWAACSAWQRLFAIPMGGSFSAQSADLYCIWAFHLTCSRHAPVSGESSLHHPVDSLSGSHQQAALWPKRSSATMCSSLLQGPALLPLRATCARHSVMFGNFLSFAPVCGTQAIPVCGTQAIRAKRLA